MAHEYICMACGGNFNTEQEVNNCTECSSPRVREIK